MELPPPSDPSITTLWLGNVEADVQEADLREVLYAYGVIQNIHLVRPAKCAFVEFASRYDLVSSLFYVGMGAVAVDVMCSVCFFAVVLGPLNLIVQPLTNAFASPRICFPIHGDPFSVCGCDLRIEQGHGRERRVAIVQGAGREGPCDPCQLGQTSCTSVR